MTTIDHRDRATGVDHDDSDDAMGVFDFPDAATDLNDAANEGDGDTSITWRERVSGLRYQLTEVSPKQWMRHEKSDADTTSGQIDPDDAEFIARAQGTSRQRLITTGLRGAVIVCLVAGPVALIFHPGSTPPQTPTSTPIATADTNAEAAASDLASAFVPTWLTAHRGDEESLERFVTDSVTAASLPQSALYTATDARLAGITQAPALAGAKAYAVTVSVDVAPATEGSGASVRRYYTVPVAVSERGVRAMALPSSTAAPSTGLDVESYYQYDVPSGAPIVKAAGDFLSSMLTGAGDVTRFTSPGATIGAVTPAPYSTVSVDSTQSTVNVGTSAPTDGQRARVLLQVSQQPVGAADAAVLPSAYALTMTGRAGRWEVSAIDESPSAKLGTETDDSTNLSGDDATDSTSEGGGGGAQTPSASESGTDPTSSRKDDDGDSGALIPDATDAPTATVPKSGDDDSDSDSGATTPAPPTTPTDPLLRDGGLDLGPR